jgi:galactokinase
VNAVKNLVEETRRIYQERYGRSSEWLSIAPGRVNLIGDHTDYNDGLAMTLAIPRYVVIAAALTHDAAAPPQLRAFSTKTDEFVTISLDADPLPKNQGWGKYLAGVAEGARRAGMTVPAMEVCCHSNLPSGAGLSSSAALSVAFLTLLEQTAGTTLSSAEKVGIAMQAEHDYADVPCGILDPFCIVNAEDNCLLLLDCRSKSATSVPWPGDDTSLLVIDSGVAHDNADGGYAIRQGESARAADQLGTSLRNLSPADLDTVKSDLAPDLCKRVRHVITENARVLAMAEAIAACDWPRAGQLLFESHASLAGDYEVSCDETDSLVALADEIGIDGGIYGARMTGGGFGGSVIALVRADRAESVTERIAEGYSAQWGQRPSILNVHPVAGASIA